MKDSIAKAAILGAAFAAFIAVVVFLTGCKAAEPYQDAPVSIRDTSSAEVYNMPDGYSNFSSKCDNHGNRVYVAFHNDGAYAAMTVVAADPSCKS